VAPVFAAGVLSFVFSPDTVVAGLAILSVEVVVGAGAGNLRPNFLASAYEMTYVTPPALILSYSDLSIGSSLSSLLSLAFLSIIEVYFYINLSFAAVASVDF
jgi:hypothetical protein